LQNPTDGQSVPDEAKSLSLKAPRTGSGFRVALGAICLLAVCALFLVRGPLRVFHGRGGDFSMPYVGSIKYEQKLEPYSPADFLTVWRAAGAPVDTFYTLSIEHLVYPPTTLLLMLPLAQMNWPHALAVYTALCTILLLHLLYSLACLIGDDWRSWRRWGFLGYALALAPIHTALSLGNLTMLVFILSMYGLLLARKKMDTAAGVLLGLALCIKPTLGIVVLVYMLLSRRWRLLAACAIVTAVVGGFAVVHMSAIEPGWRQAYQQNVAYLTGTTEGGGDFASPSTIRFDLLNLQVPAFEIVRSREAANLLAYLIVGVLGVLWLRLLVQKGKLLDYWEGSGALILLGLLPMYQHTYSACFIVIPLVWAFQNMELPVARWVMVASAVFLIPGEGILRNIRIPDALFYSTWWNFIVMPQATWGVLAVVVLLLANMASVPAGKAAKA